MKRHLIWVFLFCLVFLGVSGCSNPEERKAQLLLQQAQTMERENNLGGARDVLKNLLTTYPSSKSATEAKALNKKIHEKIEPVYVKLNKTLESVYLVLVGYQSMTGKVLTTIDQLDQGDYMFDSAYISEQIPSGIEVFIVLDGVGGFTSWAYQAQMNLAMRRTDQVRGAVPHVGEALPEILHKEYLHSKLAHNLTTLKPVVLANR